MGRPKKYATETERLEARRRSRREWVQRNPEAGKAYYQLHKEKRSQYNRQWRRDNAASVMVERARRRADKQGLPFDIDSEFVAAITPLLCPVFGVPLSMSEGTAGPYSPSLDRDNPAEGYVRGNVRVISNRANMMKQDASADELRLFAAWILSRY